MKTRLKPLFINALPSIVFIAVNLLQQHQGITQTPELERYTDYLERTQDIARTIRDIPTQRASLLLQYQVLNIPNVIDSLARYQCSELENRSVADAIAQATEEKNRVEENPILARALATQQVRAIITAYCPNYINW